MTAFGTYFVLAFQSVGGSTQYAGIALMLASITNVPSMLVASRVIGKIGRERTLLLAALIYVFRWAIQVIFPYPAAMISVQALHGLSFGFFWSRRWNTSLRRLRRICRQPDKVCLTWCFPAFPALSEICLTVFC